jgi:hypothetical protein
MAIKKLILLKKKLLTKYDQSISLFFAGKFLPDSTETVIINLFFAGNN